MPIRISRLTEADISGAVTAIQQAFANDPYNLWVYNDRTKASFSSSALESSYKESFRNSKSKCALPRQTSPMPCLGCHSVAVQIADAFWQSKLNLERNRVSLGIRCRWGICNALFYVAKESDDPEKVLGIAMWMPPRSVELKETWGEWWEGWKLWAHQVGMNLRYGRGGLNVKRYYIWKERQAEVQSQIWTDPDGYYFLNIMVVLPGEQGKGIGKLLAREVIQMADAEGQRCYLESSRDVPNRMIYEAMGFHFVKQMDCADEGEVCKLYCMVREPQQLR